MNYFELRLEFNSISPFLDVLKQELADIGFDSFMDNENGFSAFISDKLLDENSVLSLLNNYDDFILSKNFEEHPYQNWNKKWESEFQPVLINENCVIRASFHDSFDCKYEVIIDPEMSFGTGHHETTRLIAVYLLDNKPTSKKVLDFGAGTGVLSIMAEKLGAKEVVGVEVERLAVSNAVKNANVNNCQKITFIEGSGEDIPNMAYDLVLANINKNTIADHWESLIKVIHDKSTLVLSGFYNEDIPYLENLASRNGLIPLYSNSENNWAVLVLKYN